MARPEAGGEVQRHEGTVRPSSPVELTTAFRCPGRTTSVMLRSFSLTLDPPEPRTSDVLRLPLSVRADSVLRLVQNAFRAWMN
jgi:hypothetical protein